LGVIEKHAEYNVSLSDTILLIADGGTRRCARRALPATADEGCGRFRARSMSAGLFSRITMQKFVSETAAGSALRTPATQASTLPVVLALSFAHLLNDMMQSLLPAIYPIIKGSYGLDFGQIGLITLAFQLTASLLQPVVGIVTDRRPQPYSAVIGMASTLLGLVVLAQATSFGALLLGAAFVGTGSSIFHPEATRMARAASGGRHGLAQSLFQVGGQTGQAIGPLLAAFIVVPGGQRSLAWFSFAALLAMVVLFQVGTWYRHRPKAPLKPKTNADSVSGVASAPKSLVLPITVLVALMFSKSAYTSSIGTYLTFYLIEKFHVSVQTSQMLLFVFLVSQVVGSLIGGHVGDRHGRNQIIWFSILGALPFTMLLPYASFATTVVLIVIIGMIMASAFPAILVYAMDMMPKNIGTIAGIFYGVTFGLGALSAAALGRVADATSLTTVYHICAYLPLIGLVTWFLPKTDAKHA
jgi:MFS transporter, FSR family, fosmidomycin resistance protein